MTPPSVTPQGAQEHFTVKINRLVRENAASAERIEKLERTLSGEHHYFSGELKETEAEMSAWKQRAQKAEQERDTALRALAEARRKYAVLDANNG